MAVPKKKRSSSKRRHNYYKLKYINGLISCPVCGKAKRRYLGCCVKKS